MPLFIEQHNNYPGPYFSFKTGNRNKFVLHCFKNVNKLQPELLERITILSQPNILFGRLVKYGRTRSGEFKVGEGTSRLHL